MVTLSTHMRMTPVNGFDFMDVVRLVRLGATPTKACALEMARQLLSSTGNIKRWPESVRDFVTPDLIIEQLDMHSNGILSRRHALVAQVLALMGDALTGTPPEVFSEALRMCIQGSATNPGWT